MHENSENEHTCSAATMAARVSANRTSIDAAGLHATKLRSSGCKNTAAALESSFSMSCPMAAAKQASAYGAKAAKTPSVRSSLSHCPMRDARRRHSQTQPRCLIGTNWRARKPTAEALAEDRKPE